MENIPRVVMTNPARLQTVSLICQSLTRALLAVKGIPMRQTNSWQTGRFQLLIMNATLWKGRKGSHNREIKMIN